MNLTLIRAKHIGFAAIVVGLAAAVVVSPMLRYVGMTAAACIAVCIAVVAVTDAAARRRDRDDDALAARDGAESEYHRTVGGRSL